MFNTLRLTSEEGVAAHPHMILSAPCVYRSAVASFPLYRPSLLLSSAAKTPILSPSPLHFLFSPIPVSIYASITDSLPDLSSRIPSSSLFWRVVVSAWAKNTSAFVFTRYITLRLASGRTRTKRHTAFSRLSLVLS